MTVQATHFFLIWRFHKLVLCFFLSCLLLWFDLLSLSVCLSLQTSACPGLASLCFTSCVCVFVELCVFMTECVAVAAAAAAAAAVPLPACCSRLRGSLMWHQLRDTRVCSCISQPVCVYVYYGSPKKWGFSFNRLRLFCVCVNLKLFLGLPLPQTHTHTRTHRWSSSIGSLTQ